MVSQLYKSVLCLYSVLSSSLININNFIYFGNLATAVAGLAGAGAWVMARQ